MEEKINVCQTLADIAELERTHSLNEEEQRLVFERRLQVFLQIQKWREEKKLGLEPSISDTWTPEQRQRFLNEWDDYQSVLESEQMGRGQKRSHDEMHYESDQDDERPFYVESVRQVNTKKFRTKAMNYRAHFTNALANVEITNLQERLHEIFQQVLDETIGGIPLQDQVRFVLHSNQLEYPINFPLMAPNRLTTERIHAEFERVIQSNKEFRLNDTVEINVIHVSMPSGGKGSEFREASREEKVNYSYPE